MKKIICLLSLLGIAGCGTVFSGSTQDISIDSNVKDVKVYIDGAFVCNTPCVYPVERASGSISVVGKKAGYEDVGMAVKTKINPVAWGNLIMPYSWTTDIVSGSAWKYRQDGVYLNMEKENMKRAEAEIFKKESEIRRFALFNYADLKIEASKKIAGENIKALSSLTNLSEDVLMNKINNTYGEIALADSVIGK